MLTRHILQSIVAVTAVALGEPVGATILAELILEQKVEPYTYIFMILMLFGIALVELGEKSKHS